MHDIDVKLIIPIRHLHPDTTITDCLYPSFRICAVNEKIYETRIETEEINQEIGNLYSRRLKTLPCLYFEGSVSKLAGYFDINSERALTESVNKFVSAYFDSIWLIKDHSIYANECFLFIGDVFINLNSRPEIFSTASGTYPTSTLSQEEAKTANNLFNLRLEWGEAIPEPVIDQSMLNDVGSSVLKNVMHLESYHYVRLLRALISVSTARKTSFLPLKITFYVILLECLLSVDDSTELTHKVSERVAYLLGGTKADKLNNIKTVKTAYGIRSKFVHGQNLTEKKSKKNIPMPYSTMEEVSKNVDQICRLCLSMITNNYANIFNDNNIEPLLKLLDDLKFPDDK